MAERETFPVIRFTEIKLAQPRMHLSLEPTEITFKLFRLKSTREYLEETPFRSVLSSGTPSSKKLTRLT
jgi:hypothetical protein